MLVSVMGALRLTGTDQNTDKPGEIADMAKNTNQLPIPPAAIKDPDSIEMIRVWIANEQLLASLNIGVWGKQGVGEEKAWGMMLADVIRHVANAIGETDRVDPEATIRMIKKQLDAELEVPTSRHQGNFVEPVSEDHPS